MGAVTRPRISVVIPTFNRAALLKDSLASLAMQSLPPSQYEVVVIDDGSIDDTAAVCRRFSSAMRLQYFRIENSGISAAKNLGLFAASGDLLLFFDDDDVADGNMLGEHLKSHDENPQENIAMLGYTTWAPAL